MISLTKPAAFITFSLTIIVANHSLAQSELAKQIQEAPLFFDTAPQQTITQGTVTIRQSAPDSVLVSSPNAVVGAVQPYPTTGYPVGAGSTIVTLDGAQSQFSAPVASTPQPMMHQQSFSNLQMGPYGPISKDVGYAGPGDMRTHLWKGHSADLQANGISKDALMSMPMATVQQWHNYFHGTEGAPNH